MYGCDLKSLHRNIASFFTFEVQFMVELLEHPFHVARSLKRMVVVHKYKKDKVINEIKEKIQLCRIVDQM